MRVLCFVPQSRTYITSIQAILAIEWDQGIDFVFWQSGDEPGAHRYDNMTRKYQAGRQLALREGYDALLTVEDDVIVPPDVLVKLATLPADVAYGLITARYEPYFWSAALGLDGESYYDPLSNHPEQMRQHWGKVIDVVGCGLYCTLIRRHVLEQIDFHREYDNVGCDWHFSLDCQTRGFRQQMDLSVVCGHILPDGGVIYADPRQGHRIAS